MSEELQSDLVPQDDNQEFLELARERYDYGRTADAEDRAEAETDNRFANASNKDLGQWDETARKQRKKAKRPCLQWNRIPVSVQSVVNDGRQNKPSIRIAPGDGGVPHTAEYIQARIRHIEYEANADTAKDCARDQQVTSGRGALRVSTEYIPGTFQHRICIDRIDNQFSVVWDPAAVRYDRSDADWCFLISQISRDSHKRKYGKKSLVNRLDFAAAQKLAPDWIGIGTDEMIQVAEYFCKEYQPRTITDPDTGQTRIEQCATVCQYVINGAEILHKTEWIGSTIPIIPLWGREATVDGKRRTYSLTRNAQGPQQLLNLYISNLAELIAAMPRSKWQAPVGSIPENVVKDYANPNNAAAVLFYEIQDSMGRPLPPPGLISAEPPIEALVIGINQCIDGIKAAMGIYDASLGARSNETSGVAIARRKQQTSITNYHFPDNEARSNKYLGEILVEIIPQIDKQGGTYPIRTEDGKTHLVPIGVEHKDWKTGQVVCHDLKSGQYGVTVSTGPSYDSQRQETRERDEGLVQANPELIWAVGPQMFRADDSAGSEERAEALERYINLKFPGLIPPKDGQQGQLDPQKVQQQMQAMQGEVQKAHAFAANLHEQLQSKIPELQNAVRLKEMDLAFKREELAEKSRVELAKLGSAEDIARLEQEIEALKHQAGLVSDQQQQQADHEHQAAQQHASQDHASDLAAGAQGAAQQAQQAEHEHADSQQAAAAEQAQEPDE